MPPCEQQRVLELKREEEEDKKKARAVIRGQAKKMGWRLTEIRKDVFVASKPFSNDKITFTVKEKGIIETKTDKISMPNHANAEKFLANVAQLMGGKWKIFHRHGKGEFHTHAHHHHV